MRGLPTMKEKYKWMLITSIIVVIIALILGFLLKNHYDKGQEKQQGREHVQINNKNVKLFQNISYGEGLPNSKLDIITPSDMSKDTKLPVIFWMMVVGFIPWVSNIKIPIMKKIDEMGYF